MASKRSGEPIWASLRLSDFSPNVARSWDSLRGRLAEGGPISSFQSTLLTSVFLFFCCVYWVQSKINFLVGPQDPLLATVRRRKLPWFGHVTRHDSFFQNHSSGHIGEWVTPWSAEELLNGQRERVGIPVHTRTAHNGLGRKHLKRISAESSIMSPSPHPPPTQSVKWMDWSVVHTVGVVVCLYWPFVRMSWKLKLKEWPLMCYPVFEKSQTEVMHTITTRSNVIKQPSKWPRHCPAQIVVI